MSAYSQIQLKKDFGFNVVFGLQESFGFTLGDRVIVSSDIIENGDNIAAPGDTGDIVGFTSNGVIIGWNEGDPSVVADDQNLIMLEVL